jgi:hypothetical protein
MMLGGHKDRSKISCDGLLSLSRSLLWESEHDNSENTKQSYEFVGG